MGQVQKMSGALEELCVRESTMAGRCPFLERPVIHSTKREPQHTGLTLQDCEMLVYSSVGTMCCFNEEQWW